MKSFKEFIVEKRLADTAWVILHTKDKMLLGKRSPTVNNPNSWNFFGGHVDSGETPLVAAVRELKEETSYSISPSLLKEIAVIGNAHYFTARLTDPDKVKPSEEISKVQRFKLTDLPSNLHAKTQNFFDKLDNLFG